MPLLVKRPGSFESWNSRIHMYLGLYLFLFIWLFCLTGLLLNHPGWAFADFWPTRRENTMEVTIRRPPPGSDLDEARNILGQLGISGEIEWTEERVSSDRFDFRTSRPGHIVEIKSDFGSGHATIQTIVVNAWGVMRILHTFTGVRSADERNNRDWILTTVWAFAMDATAAGLILMVLGSYYMFWRLPGKRSWGLLALGSGYVVCALFVVGLKWIS